MNEAQRSTAPEDIDGTPESILVTLSHLRTRSGEPVRVLCLPVDIVEVTRILGLPGEGPKREKRDPATERAENAKILKECGRPLIEAGTAWVDESGELVRPAFYFSGTPPHPRSLPGRWLRVSEQSDLMNVVLQLSGFLGGADESARFHAGVGARGLDGVGAAPAGESAGTNGLGDAA